MIASLSSDGGEGNVGLHSLLSTMIQACSFSGAGLDKWRGVKVIPTPSLKGSCLEFTDTIILFLECTFPQRWVYTCSTLARYIAPLSKPAVKASLALNGGEGCK